MKLRLPTLRTRDRRAVLLAALVLAPAWVVTSAAPKALASHNAARDQAEISVAKLTRARATIAEEAVSRDSFAARATRLVALAPRLVGGRTSAEATATLAGIVNGAADRARVRIVRIEPLPDSVAGAFARVTVRVEAQGDVSGVSRWLATLEEGTPSLVLRQLSLSALEPAAATDRPEVLRVELVASGWNARRAEVSRR